jgi:hypothetical protein
MSRSINPTVPDLLRANMPVSEERLQSELRSLNRSIRYHLPLFLRQLLQLEVALPAAMILSTKKLERLGKERRMVLQAINDRRALGPEGDNHDNRA